MTAFRWMLVLPLLFFLTGPVSAQDVGTAAEAKAMLEKVVADMKANKAKTLQDITAGTYNQKDLYPSAVAQTACSPRMARIKA